MSIRVQHRRDSRTNCEAATPAAGELFGDTTLNALRYGDGTTLGGILQKRWGYSFPVSPPQITADQNNYNPTDLSIAETLLLTSDAKRTITGLAGGVAGARKTIINRGSSAIILANNNTSSTAANRFLFDADVVIRPNGSMELQYSAADNRWMRAAGGTKLSAIPEELLLQGKITPPQITANQNDYAPTDITLATTLRLSSDASRNITGIVDPREGAVKTIVNVGANPIVLKDADTGSTAANRFDFGADIALAAKNSCTVRYDGVDARWKIVASTAGAAVADGAVTASKFAASGLRPGMINGSLVESHSGNAVTFALKTTAGADPSPSDPVRFVFQNGAGGYSFRDVTAALSLTISSGSTLGASNNAAFRVWLVAFDTGSDVVIGAVNCASTSAILGLYDGTLYSSTAEGGAGAADNAQTIYSAAAQTSKYLCLMGYADYDTGLAAVGNWSASPSRLTLYFSGGPRPGDPTGKSVFVGIGSVATGSTGLPLDDTIPQITEGDQYHSAAIAPTSACNMIEIEGQLGLSCANDTLLSMALFRDSIANALTAVWQLVPAVRQINNHVIYRVLAGSTSPTTFKLRAGPDVPGRVVTLNGTAGGRIFGGVCNSYLKLTEIMG